MPKFRTTITFSVDNVKELDGIDKSDIREFIIDALSSWGGQRHPDDWLFGSLRNITMSKIEKVK